MEKVLMQSAEKVYKPCEYSNQSYDFKSTVAQFYVTCVESIFLILIGMVVVMPTIVVGALHNKEGNSMSLDDDAASWIGSLLFVCHPCGAMTSGILSEKFGRRGAMMLVNIPLALGWVLLYYATTFWGLCLATIVAGYAIGLCEAPVAAYVSEVSEPHLRGILNCIVVAACNLGCGIELYVGSEFDWRISALVCAGLPAVSLVLFLTIPESPVWLITKGRMEDAQKALGWLRGFLEPHHVQKEFDELVRYSKQSNSLSHNLSNGNLEEKIPLDGENQITKEKSKNWFVERYRDLRNPRLYLPLRLVFILFFVTVCATLAPFKSYLVEILDQFWYPVNSKYILVMTGVMNFLGAVAAILLINLCGKRLLTIICMAIAVVSIFILGIFASFFTHYENEALSYFLIFVLALFFFTGNIGVVNIPWMLIYEVYPVRGRGFAAGLSAAWSYFSTFLLTKSYLQTQSIIGLSGMFYLYSLISLAGLIYIWLYMPETERKSLELIESYFTPNHDRKEKYRMPSRKASKV